MNAASTTDTFQKQSQNLSRKKEIRTPKYFFFQQDLTQIFHTQNCLRWKIFLEYIC